MRPVVLKARGTKSIELKFRYAVEGSQKQKRENYSTDIHFFFPASFKINPDAYERPQFYRDAKVYLRADTPVMSVDQILREDYPDSPLVRLRTMVRSRRSEESVPVEAFVYESKMLAAIYKSLLRRTVGSLNETVAESDDSDPLDPDADDPTEEQMDEARQRNVPAEADIRGLHRVAKEFHKLASCVVGDGAWAPVYEHCVMIDEHMSLLLEHYLGSCLADIENKRAHPAEHDSLVEVINQEAGYRRDLAYPTTLSEEPKEDELEEYVYREKMLKTYASEILFLNVKSYNESKRAEHLLYAVAAGIAMVFATAIAFYAQSVFGGISAALFALLVVSYMIKDRLKDAFKSYFRRSVGGRFYDRKMNLYDANLHKKLARVRERVNFVSEKHKEEAVARARNRGPFETRLTQTKPESHFVYHQSVTIKADSLRQFHKRIEGLADIVIINLDRMLIHLAKQSTKVAVVKDNSVVVHHSDRVYHLNVIVVSTDRTGRMINRFRLIVDREGIKRIEPVLLHK